MQGFIEEVRSGYGRFPEATFHTYLRALSTTHMLYMCIQQAKLKNTLDMEEVSSMHESDDIATSDWPRIWRYRYLSGVRFDVRCTMPRYWA